MKVACESGIDDRPVIAMFWGLRDTAGGRIITGVIHVAGAIELNPPVLCEQPGIAQFLPDRRGARAWVE